MPGPRPSRSQRVDQLLERHVGVRERREVDASDLTQEIFEGRVRFDGSAQNQGVDEHTDDVVQHCVTSSGHRCADRDIFAGGQLGEQNRQGGMYDHEGRRAVRAAELLEREDQICIDLELVRSASGTGDGRTWPVGGQFQLIGCSAEASAPIVLLSREHRLGVVLVAENLSLPQREVGVLHLERSPLRVLPVRAGNVCRHHVASEWTHRESVGGDVMDHEREHVLGVRQFEQQCPEGQLNRQVERAERELEQGGGKLRFLRGRDLQFDCCRIGSQYVLVADTVAVREHGAQRFVSIENVGERGTQRREVERAGQGECHRDVVHGRFGLESVEEPHALLSQRQRDVVVIRLRRQRNTVAGRIRRIHGRSEFGNGRSVEECADIDGRTAFGVDPRDHAGGVERVAAEREEVVVDADAVDAEHGLEDRDQCRLGLRARCAVLPRQRREIGRGQCLSVELSAGTQRELVQDDEHRRHHVLRHAPSHRVREAVVIDFGIGADDVPDELLFRLLGRMEQHSRLSHLGLGEQSRFDLAQLDAQAA